MILRELLKSLHAVDDKHLDMEVMVSPHSGGYEGISHISVLHFGHPVIHLAEPKPAEPPPDLWESQEGGVPVVNPDDLRSMWKLFGDIQARTGGGGGIIDTRIYEGACSPGADVHAVWFRASMLWALNQMIPEQVAKWTHNGQLDDVVPEVLAAFPMKRMRTGIVYEEPPFDVEEFVRQIGART